MRKLLSLVVVVALLAPVSANAWWEKGHRLVASLAWAHLTPVARENVKALLGTESMADVAPWADVDRPLETQTGGWHFTDIPGDKTTYDRDRDCPTQPGVKIGSYNDKVRDCITDRILFFQARVADPRLDPIDRATSLKFLIHFVGDVHQPFHASGVERGGNGITVTAFGQPTCGSTAKCNLHAIWDGYLIEHAKLSDEDYIKYLEKDINHNPPTLGPNDPVLWTQESKVISDSVMVTNGANIDEEYYTANMPVIDAQLELAGLRLASMLNALYTTPPVPFKPAPIDPAR